MLVKLVARGRDEPRVIPSPVHEAVGRAEAVGSAAARGVPLARRGWDAAVCSVPLPGDSQHSAFPNAELRIAAAPAALGDNPCRAARAKGSDRRKTRAWPWQQLSPVQDWAVRGAAGAGGTADRAGSAPAAPTEMIAHPSASPACRRPITLPLRETAERTKINPSL